MHRNYYSSSFANANGPLVGASSVSNNSRSCHSNSNANSISSNKYHKYDHLANGNPNLNMRSIYENYLISKHDGYHAPPANLNYVSNAASSAHLRYDDNEYPIPTSKIQYYATEPADIGYSNSGNNIKSLASNTSSYSCNSSSNSNNISRYNRNRDRDTIDNDYIPSSSVVLASLSPTRDERETSTSRFLASYDPLTETENLLRLKWLDNSPRMSRLREHRQKRLMNKLEQFELWDAEQEQKQKQYELAREQRYKNIMDRLKNQEFCVNLMKKRHESDLETTRELESYPMEHHYVDVLDDPKTNYRGPVSQYRKFQAEMDDKLKTLQHDIDLVNPRYRIEQAIIPRLERTRELYSVEPDTYTQRGKRVQKRPPPLNRINNNTSTNKSANASDTYQNYHNNSRDRPSILSQSLTRGANSAAAKLKPIIHNSNQDDQNKPRSPKGGSELKKAVYFNDEVEYSSRKESLGSEEALGAALSNGNTTTANNNNNISKDSNNESKSSSSPPPSQASSAPSASNDKVESTTSSE